MISSGLREGFIMLKNYLSGLRGGRLRDGRCMSLDVNLASVQVQMLVLRLVM